MQRLSSLDPRALMAIVGGVLGVVLVAVVFAVRGPFAPSALGYPYGVVPSYAPPPFEPLGPDRLFAAYDRLGRVTVYGRPATLSVTRAEDLVLPSGRIVVADVYAFDARASAVALPPGRHPVLLLQVTSDDGPAVAAALVRVAGTTPTRWDAAPTYDVDSGTASFSSPEAVSAARALSSKQADALIQRLLDEYDSGFEMTAAITADAATSANLVSFLSGYGDGSYPAWFGYDATGKAVALLTSFELIDDQTRPRAPKGSSAP